MKYTFGKIIPKLKEDGPEYIVIKQQLRFIVDAQLPKKLSDFLVAKGFDLVHTLDLPDKNATTDKYITTLAQNENRVLISKDDDFLRSFLIANKPKKLILVKTGNIRNTVLLELFDAGLTAIASLIHEYSLVEITQAEIIVHR